MDDASQVILFDCHPRGLLLFLVATESRFLIPQPLIDDLLLPLLRFICRGLDYAWDWILPKSTTYNTRIGWTHSSMQSRFTLSWWNSLLFCEHENRNSHMAIAKMSLTVVCELRFPLVYAFLTSMVFSWFDNYFVFCHLNHRLKFFIKIRLFVYKYHGLNSGSFSMMQIIQSGQWIDFGGGDRIPT